MTLYELIWEDRHGVYKEWLGTKREVQSRRATIRRRATRRPYDQIEILSARPCDIPTDKQGLLHWLNNERSGAQSPA